MPQDGKCECECQCEKKAVPVWKIPICIDCSMNIHANEIPKQADPSPPKTAGE